MWATTLGRATLLAWVGIALFTIASFLPWAKVWFITVNGMDGDGKITAALGAAAALFFGFGRIRSVDWKKGLVVGGLVASVAAAGTYVYEFFHILGTSTSDDDLFDIDVSVGVGVYLGVVGALLPTVATAVALRERTRTPDPAATPSGPTLG